MSQPLHKGRLTGRKNPQRISDNIKSTKNWKKAIKEYRWVYIDNEWVPAAVWKDKMYDGNWLVCALCHAPMFLDSIHVGEKIECSSGTQEVLSNGDHVNSNEHHKEEK